MDIFNYITGLIAELVKDPVLAQHAFVLLMAASAFVFFLALMFFISLATRPARGRLKKLEKEDGTPAPSGPSTANKALAAASAVIMPAGGETRSRFQRMLIHAGYRKPNAIMVFYGIKLLVIILLPLAVMTFGGFIFSLPATVVLMFTFSALMAGIVLPALVLERLVMARQTRLRRGLPDALDLLVVCSEAGLGLKPALQRVADDIFVSHPDLAEEFALVNTQTRVGVENVTALKDLADRTGLDDINGLVSTLSQSMRFGTSLAKTLRIYSEEMRDKRTQKAEETAAKLGTKLLFPLIFCIFPSFFLVALGPPFLGAVEALRGVGHL